MPPLKLLLALSVVCLAPLAAAAANAADLYHAQSFTLVNGLQAVVIEDHRAPVVTHMIWYKTGAADDPVGKSGIAHFLEHLTFKGTLSVPPDQFVHIVARNGGRDNAFTSYDYTAFYEDVASDKLALVMQLEADRMAHLTMAAAQVTSERQVILEERRERVDNDPEGLFQEQMAAAQYLASPTRLPVLGWKHEMEGLTRADALTHYHAHFAPNNAVLVVAGDISLEAVQRLAEKYYGVIPRRAVPPRVRAQEPPQIAARRVVMADPRVRQASWMRSYLAPTLQTGESRFALPLLLLADILGGGPSSRLHKALVLDNGLATTAGAGYEESGLGLSSFELLVRPKPGASTEAVEAKVEAVLADLLANGVTAAELARAKVGYHAGTIYGRDSLDGTARVFGEALVTGLTVADVAAMPERIEAVTLEQVDEAARYVFDIRKSVTGVLVPKPAS